MMISTMTAAPMKPTAHPAVPLRRRIVGAALAVVALPALTVLLLVTEHADLATALLCYLTLTMLVATIGGLWPSVPTAIASYAVSHWFFTPPFRTWTVDRGQDLLALGVFLAVSVVVGLLVNLVGRRAAETAQAEAEAAAEAARVEVLAEGTRTRTALLSAVSHDLRTPLATIKTWLTGLLEGDVAFEPREVDEILTAAVQEVDRLNTLVGNLLDMSRLQIGAVAVHNQPVALDAVASAAVGTLPHRDLRIHMDIPDTLPHVNADEALLERVVANLIDNALRHTPERSPVEVRAEECGNSPAVELRIIDHGPGISTAGQQPVVPSLPDLRLKAGRGAGLGLAVAKGLTAALHGDLAAHETPGGGTTMVLKLATAP
jgi:two-component system, OmpR family, sensor histidine kinase KdpD